MNLRKIALVLLATLVASCGTSRPPSPTSSPVRKTTPTTAQAPPEAPPPPLFGPPAPPSGEQAATPSVATGPRHPLQVRKSSENGITFTAVTFDRRDYVLKVVDQKGGPGSQFDNAAAAARAQDGLAAINGGFFSPEGEPVGLVITDGERRGYFNATSYLGTGILDGLTVSLATRESYQKSPELLQSGPRLVWAGETLTGLSRESSRSRSFLIWDGQDHFGLAHADSATLKGLSDTLQSQPLPGFRIRYAVNLDGGTSCDLWVSDQVSGGGFTKSSFFRKKARNYLVLQDR